MLVFWLFRAEYQQIILLKRQPNVTIDHLTAEILHCRNRGRMPLLQIIPASNIQSTLCWVHWRVLKLVHSVSRNELGINVWICLSLE